MGMSISLSSIGVGKGGGPSASQLLTRLQNYYMLDEASGNALDAIGGSNLTAGGTSQPTSVAGLINTARNFDTNVNPSAQNFNFSSSSPVFKFLSTTFAISLWFKVDANFIANQAQTGIFKKSNLTTGTNRGWAIYSNMLSGILRIGCSPDGTSGSQIVAAKSFTPTADQWVHVVAYREFGNVIGIAVNGSAYTTNTYTGVIADTASAVNLGPSDRTQAAGNMVIDEVAVWTNFFPSATQVTWLYNSGAGRSLSEYAGGPSS